MDNLGYQIISPNLYAGEAIVQRIPPMPVYSLVLAERLMGRFDRIWDPMPGKFDVVGSLEDIQAADEIIAYKDLDFTQVHLPPAPAAISAPDPRKVQELALHCLETGMEYLAVFGRATQLAGLRRYHSLFSKHPPNRVYINCQAWAQNRQNRGGSDGAWNPATWMVWSGLPGQPAIENSPEYPELRWIPDKHNA